MVTTWPYRARRIAAAPTPSPALLRLPDPARARVVAASPAIDPYQAKAKRL